MNALPNRRSRRHRGRARRSTLILRRLPRAGAGLPDSGALQGRQEGSRIQRRPGLGGLARVCGGASRTPRRVVACPGAPEDLASPDGQSGRAGLPPTPPGRGPPGTRVFGDAPSVVSAIVQVWEESGVTSPRRKRRILLSACTSFQQQSLGGVATTQTGFPSVRSWGRCCGPLVSNEHIWVLVFPVLCPRHGSDICMNG